MKTITVVALLYVLPRLSASAQVPPTILFVNSTATQGGAAIINGTGLAPISGAPLVLFDSQVVTVNSWSPTQISCAIPPGEGHDSSIVVIADGLVSAPYSFSYLAPFVASVSPGSASTAGGGTLTVGGANFGFSAEVSIGGNVCPVISQTHTAIQLVAPAGQGTALSVEVSVAGLTGNGSLFSYDAPSITNVDPPSGSTSGTCAITITGTCFGTADTGPAAVTIGGADATILSRTHGEIICLAPAATPGNAAVVVDVGGQSSTAATFLYDSALAGSGEDFRLETLVNGAGDACAVAKTAAAGDFLSMHYVSPGGTFDGTLTLFVGQLFFQGSPPPSQVLFPEIHVNPNAIPLPFLIFSAVEPAGVLGSPLLPPAGFSFGAEIHPALPGFGVRLQAFSLAGIAGNGIFAVTDAHDISIN